MKSYLHWFPKNRFPNLEFEKKLGFPESEVIGVDEVGRGCIAGPVVACAVVLPGLDSRKRAPDFLLNIQDSKKISELKREVLFEPIREFLVDYSFGMASSEEIDQINIFQATFLAMKRALQGLKNQSKLVLIDGKFAPKDMPDYFFTPVIKGDMKSVSIACASILAKVFRDRILKEYDVDYPQYHFAKHKGYGTKKHLEALKNHGVLPFHRRSFAPVREVLSS